MKYIATIILSGIIFPACLCAQTAAPAAEQAKPAAETAEPGHPAREYFKGSGFDLVKINDVLMGTFGDIPVWADKQCGSHIKGSYKPAKEIINFAVAVKETDKKKKITGEFGKNVITVEKVDKEKSVVTLSVNGKEVPVAFAFEKANGPHQVGVNFNFKNADKEYSVKLDGEGCLGSIAFYSVFLYGMTTAI